MSDDQPEIVTRPMVETLLSRIKSLETRIEASFVKASEATTARFEQLIGELRTEIGEIRTEIGEIRADIGEIRTDAGAFRTETNENFSRVRDEIAILNEDTLKTRAGQRELLRRVEQLESKVS